MCILTAVTMRYLHTWGVVVCALFCSCGPTERGAAAGGAALAADTALTTKPAPPGPWAAYAAVDSTALKVFYITAMDHPVPFDTGGLPEAQADSLMGVAEAWADSVGVRALVELRVRKPMALHGLEFMGSTFEQFVALSANDTLMIDVGDRGQVGIVLQNQKAMHPKKKRKKNLMLSLRAQSRSLNQKQKHMPQEQQVLQQKRF